MDKIRSLITTTLLSGAVFFISCKKEKSCEGCINGNKPPIAIAGPDQVIILPADSVSLDGSASNDADGTISEWLWKKISGPASFNIVNVAASKTVARNLDTGIYRFELKVTDNGNLSATDTVQITVTDLRPPNQPPVANAGADQTITLPTNTITLNGSSSTDPDNNISSYLWTKISGPSSFSITNTNALQTQVTNLAEGVYQFELKVTDAGGLFSKDTMQLTVNTVSSQPCVPNTLMQASCDNSMRPVVCGQLISIATLSGVPWAVTSAGNKLVFAIYGSFNDVNDMTLDIYDLTTNTLSTQFCNFSQPSVTTAPTVIGVGNKILFAGGEIGQLLASNVVDIYDVSTNAWSVSHLSIPGMFFSTAVCGNKVFFTGGFENAPGNVDIYDAASDSWSTASLSVPRNAVTAFSGNNKVYFAGGTSVSNVIDIYDNASNSWSTSTMQFPRLNHAGISVDDVLYFAGGGNAYPYYPNNPTICSVETLNVITGDRTSMNLSGMTAWQANNGQNAVLKQNKIIFLRQQGGVDANRFDIYDTQTNTWSIGMLPQALPAGAMAISVNNTIYIAGGNQNTQVWKLEF